MDAHSKAWRQHDRVGSVFSVRVIQILCRVAIQSRGFVQTAACSTSPESSTRSVVAIKPAGVTAIAVWIFIMNTHIVIPSRPTHVHLILWSGIILAYRANVVISPSIAIWISVQSQPTLCRIGAFEAEWCPRQRILWRIW